MKNFLKMAFLAMILSSPYLGSSQTPGWTWAKDYGGNREDYCNGMACDLFGNVYLAGEFRSNLIYMGPDTLKNIDVHFTNMYVTKLDLNGTVKWARQSIQKGYVHGTVKATCVKTDPSGNIIVVGNFNCDSLSFDKGLTWLGISPGDPNWGDIFIVKYSPAGNVLWSKSAGGNSYDCAGGNLYDWRNGAAVDNNGNIYITGSIASDSAFFDTTRFNKPIDCTESIFLAKYDPNGKLLWFKGYGAYGENIGFGVACDKTGNVFLTGSFEDNNLNFGSVFLTNFGGCDAFLTKFNTSGKVLWAKNFGNQRNDIGIAVTTDKAGNVYFTGQYYSDIISFQGINITNIAPTSNSPDVYIAKFSTDGIAQWAKSVGGINDEYVYDITVDTLGNTFIVGKYNSITFIAGPRILYNSDKVTLTSELYMLKLLPNGDVKDAIRAAGSLDDVCTGVIVYNIPGYGLTTFGAGTFRSFNMRFGWNDVPTKGLDDIFFGKIGLVTSIDETATLNDHLKIYPNPSDNGTFYLHSIDQNSGRLKIIMYDCLGNVVLNEIHEFTNSVIQFELKEPMPGIYGVELINEVGEKSTAKLIIR